VYLLSNRQLRAQNADDEGAGIAGVLGELCTVMDGNDRHVGVCKRLRNWAVL